MTTEQLDMLPLEDLKKIPKLSKTPEKTTEPDPEEETEPEPEPESEPEKETEESEKPRSFNGMSTGYVNIYTWGVRDVRGNWVVIPGDPDTAPMDRRQVARPAENLTHREALAVFEKNPYAFQLVEGCDVWACLNDEVVTYAVRKERKDVPAPEAVPGAGSDSDGPGHNEEAPSTPSEGPQGDA